MAVFLSVIGTPPVLWLERKRVPSLVAVLLVVTGMITILAIVGVVVGTSVNSFYTQLPVYQTRLQDQVSAFQTFWETKGILGTDKVLLGYVNPGAVMSMTARLLAGLGSTLSNIVLILITVAFILIEASSFPVKLRAVLGHSRQVFPQFTSFVGDIERYMIIKTSYQPDCRYPDRNMAGHTRSGFSHSLGVPGFFASLCPQCRLSHRCNTRSPSYACPARNWECRRWQLPDIWSLISCSVTW